MCIRDRVFTLTSQRIVKPEEANEDEKSLLKIAMWASEPIPFDPMEIALHQAYSNLDSTDERPNFKFCLLYTSRCV